MAFMITADVPEPDQVTQALSQLQVADTTSATPTNLFSLPLELRQQIYEHLLPTDRMVTFPPQQHLEGEKDFNAVIRSGARVGSELLDWARQSKCGHRIVMLCTPGAYSSKLPATMDLASSPKVEIVISHYHGIFDDEFGQMSPGEYYSACSSKNIAGISALRRNMEAVTKLLCRYDSLNELSIRFAYQSDSEDWCLSYDEPSVSETGKVLRCIEGFDRCRPGEGDPIVAFLLRPLRKLPKCASVGIGPFSNMIELPDFDDFDDPVPEDHDGPWTTKLFHGLSARLQRTDSAWAALARNVLGS